MMMEKEIARAVRMVLAGCMAVVSAAGAQEVQRVEITGSSIKRIAQEGALPVQVLNRTDIERTGATSVAELMERIPAMQGFTEASSSVGGGGLGLSTANIHSIGSNRTLVLLNGRRLASSGQQSLTGNNAAINLNTIPLAAVERVEVLTDGASAIYGSDAIGGVVNFILRRNFEGGEVSAGAFLPRAGAREKDFSVTGGVGNLADDGYNLILAAGRDTRSPLAARDRAFASTKSKRFTENGKQYSLLPTSTYSSPANIESNDGQFSGLRNPYYEANKRCPADHAARENRRVPGTFYCAYDPAAALEIYPEMQRETLLVAGEKMAGDFTLFASVVAGRSTVRSVRAAPPPDITVAPGSPFYSAVAALGYTGEINARWRGLDAGGRTVDYVDEAYQVVAGARGKLMGWDVDLAFTRSQSRAEQNLISGNLTADGLDLAVTAGTIDPFAAPGGQSAAGLRTLDAIQARGYFSGGVSTLDQVALQGARPLMTLPGGEVQLGAGISFLRDRTEHKPGLLAQQREAGGLADELTIEVPSDVSRRAAGVFAELLAPLSKELEVSAALRSDRYSDFSTTTNYKLGARYTPLPSLLLRGAVGSGFHAPSAPQLAPIRQIVGETDFYDCPFAAGDPRAASCNSSDVYKVFAAGNPDLQPETSRQWTLGARFEPAAAFSLGLDVWNVKISDRIGGAPSDEEVFSDPQRYARYLTSYDKNGRTELALVYPNENGGQELFRGVDLDARLRLATPLGRLTTTAYATWMLKSERQQGKGTMLASDLGRADGLGNVTLRLIGRVSTTLEHGKFAHTLALNHKSGYAEVFDTVEMADLERRVSAYSTADWQTRLRIDQHWSLVAGVHNLFDQDPPFSGSGSRGAQANYNNTVANPRGRSYDVRLTARF